MDISQSFDEPVSDYKDQSKIKEELRTFADFANGGLTVVPATIFKKKYLTKLDLSGNNIRSLPTDIGNLSNLKHLNLSRNGFRCSNPDDTNNIPREIKKIRGLEYLNISECNLSFIPSSIWEIISLISLDISQNKIYQLPANVGNLDRLQWLNAQHTGLKTIPEEIVGCVCLETLMLYGNQISTLPYVLAEMEKLKTISINLRHMADQVDSNMESLLQSGQIKSDHISNTIFNLPRVEKIELEYCKINFVHCFHSQYLTELLLRGNLFRDIPDSLFDLKELTMLDLSDNLLKSINKDIIKLTKLKMMLLSKNNLESVCGDIFEMKALEFLDLSHNLLQRVVITSAAKNGCLKSLNLSHNIIDILPDTFINLSSVEDLELSNNKIKELPVDLCLMDAISKVHQYNGLYKVGLWLLNNPICFPPSTIWNTKNIQQIYSYLKKIKIQRINKKDPIRIVLLGDNNLQKLRFLSNFLNKTMPNAIQFLTIENWTSPNYIPFVLINIDSNPIYSSLWRYFIDDNSLIWLFIDEENGSVIEQFDKWIGFVTDFARYCIVQTIVTQRFCESNNTEENCDTNLKTEFCDIFDQINEKYQECKILILPEVLSISTVDCITELERYKSRLEYQAIDKSLFTEESCFEILKEKARNIEKLLKSKKVVYINLETISVEIKEAFDIGDNILHNCLEILHKKGKIFWFRNNGVATSKIYPFISILFGSITSIIKTDYIDDLDLNTNPLLRADAMMTAEMLEQIKFNFYNYGEIPLQLYKILTFRLLKSQLLKDFLIDASVAWTVPIPQVPGRQGFIWPYLVLPYLNQVELDNTYFLNEVLLKNKNIKLDFALSIEHHSSHDTAEIFINLTCAINRFAVTRFDWMNFCYFIYDGGDVSIHKRNRQNSVLIIDIISRVWSSPDIKFREWLDNWYNLSFSNRFNSTFVFKDIVLEELESPIKDCLL